jgi:dolichyl-diphosphooligosaccharide--protein glycosyltransferase
MNGIFLSYILSFANFGAIRKDFGRLRRTGIFYALRRSIRIKHLLLAPIIAFVIFLPNVLLAVDAGSSYEWESENKNWYSDRFMGALGGAFMSEKELEGYEALANFAEKYNEPSTIEKRPAVASWWDYGFYNLQIGKHPTCADPFQNGYFWASRFLLSQNETHALQMIAARLLSYEGSISRAQGIEFIRAAGVEEPEAAYDALIKYEYTPRIEEEQVVELLALIKESTGKSIEYFVTTNREFEFGQMPPYTVILPGITLGAIVRLSGFNESDFINTLWAIAYDQRGVVIPQEQWMKSYRTISDSSGSFTVLNKEEALRYVRENREEGYVTQPIMTTMTDKLVNSTIYRLYVGLQPQEMPGLAGEYLIYRYRGSAPAYGMKHFRTIFNNGYVTVARYYPGAIIEGKVYDSNGLPLPGITVEIREESGVMHDFMSTEGDGSFTLVAPEGDLRIAVTQNGGAIAESAMNISFEQAMNRDKIRNDIHLTVKELEGTIEGRAFLDNNMNMIFDEGDTPAINGTVMLMRPEEFNRIAQSSDQLELLRALTGAKNAEIADGTFEFEGIDVGSYMLLATSGEYAGINEIIVNAGEEATIELILAYNPQASQMGQLPGNLSFNISDYENMSAL